jgi:hypothetical protein
MTLDTHVDISPAAFRKDTLNYVTGIARNQGDIPKMEAGGLDAASAIRQKADATGPTSASRTSSGPKANMEDPRNSATSGQRGSAATGGGAVLSVAIGSA